MYAAQIVVIKRCVGLELEMAYRLTDGSRSCQLDTPLDHHALCCVCLFGHVSNSGVLNL